MVKKSHAGNAREELNIFTVFRFFSLKKRRTQKTKAWQGAHSSYADMKTTKSFFFLGSKMFECEKNTPEMVVSDFMCEKEEEEKSTLETVGTLTEI